MSKTVGWEKTDTFCMGYNLERRLIGRVWRRISDLDRRWAATYYPKEGSGFSQDGFTENMWAKIWIEELEKMPKERLIIVRKTYVPQDYFLEEDGLT